MAIRFHLYISWGQTNCPWAWIIKLGCPAICFPADIVSCYSVYMQLIIGKKKKNNFQLTVNSHMNPHFTCLLSHVLVTIQIQHPLLSMRQWKRQQKVNLASGQIFTWSQLIDFWSWVIGWYHKKIFNIGEMMTPFPHHHQSRVSCMNYVSHFQSIHPTLLS